MVQTHRVPPFTTRQPYIIKVPYVIRPLWFCSLRQVHLLDFDLTTNSFSASFCSPSRDHCQLQLCICNVWGRQPSRGVGLRPYLTVTSQIISSNMEASYSCTCILLAPSSLPAEEHRPDYVGFKKQHWWWSCRTQPSQDLRPLVETNYAQERAAYGIVSTPPWAEDCRNKHFMSVPRPWQATNRVCPSWADQPTKL